MSLSWVVFGATCLRPWINLAHQISVAKGLSAISDGTFQVANQRVLTWGVIQILVLAFLIGVSVFKPWGGLGGSECIGTEGNEEMREPLIDANSGIQKVAGDDARSAMRRG